MNQDFATFLRTQRRNRKLSQVNLARRAQVAERTLRHWELGSASPGQWELDSVLTALELTPSERASALALVATRRGIHLARREATAQGETLGPLPGLGNLLQAMRLRRGLTQEHMAEELRISRSTILRWEATQSLPSEENIDRLCRLLGGYPEERTALLRRRLHTPGANPTLSINDCREQIAALKAQVNWLQTPLVDLQALALKRQLWLRAAASEEALILLVEVQVTHSFWLMMQERRTEAEACAQHCLNLMEGRVQDGHAVSHSVWRTVINLASKFVSESRGGNTAGWQLINRWLPVIPKAKQTTLWCDMAVYAGLSHQHELAASYLTQAKTLLPYNSDTPYLMEYYYPVSQAKTLLSAGRPWEAMEKQPPLHDVVRNAATQARYHLWWTEALLEAGEKDAAQRHMDQLSAFLIEYPQPLHVHRFHTLAARI